MEQISTTKKRIEAKLLDQFGENYLEKFEQLKQQPTPEPSEPVSTAPSEQKNVYRRIFNIDKIRYINVSNTRLCHDDWKALHDFLKYQLGCWAAGKYIKQLGHKKIFSMLEELVAADTEGTINTTPGQWLQGYINKLTLKQAS